MGQAGTPLHCCLRVLHPQPHPTPPRQDPTPANNVLPVPTLPILLLPAQISLTPVLDPGGGVANFVAVQRDVSELRAAREVLVLRDRALANLSEGITISDPTLPDNPTIYCNDAFLVGLSGEGAACLYRVQGCHPRAAAASLEGIDTLFARPGTAGSRTALLRAAAAAL